MLCIQYQITKNLTQDLLKPKYKGSTNKFKGHCYIATETFYHLWGKKNGYKPYYIKVENKVHWFLKKNHDIIDLTKNQFNFKLNYKNAICCGFLTKNPSRRSKLLISKIKKC